MSLSLFEKFVSETRMAGFSLLRHEIIEKDGKVFGLDLQRFNRDQILVFPFHSKYLQGIERLKLPNVNLSRYPDIFDLGSLKFLKMNSLRGGKLPDAFYDLSELEVVNIAGNQIHRLSSELKNLKELRCLALGKNHLEYLPDVFSALKKLEYLYLYNNELRELPESIGNLHNLKVLVIEANHLTRLPTSIMKLTTLSALKYRRNPLRLTPGNHIWLEMLEDAGCQFQTNEIETCYHFSIDYWDENFR